MYAWMYARIVEIPDPGHPGRNEWTTYSYFEKGCRKKYTRQSRKVLGVALRALFFKEIWKNGTGGHGHVFARTKGEQQK